MNYAIGMVIRSLRYIWVSYLNEWLSIKGMADVCLTDASVVNTIGKNVCGSVWWKLVKKECDTISECTTFTYITYPCIYHRGANNLFRHLYPSGVMSKIFANWLTYFNSTIRWFVAVVAGHLCVTWYSSVIRHNTEIGSFDLALYAFIRHVLCLG